MRIWAGDAEIRIVPDSEVSQMVSELRFPIPEVVSIRMVIEATGPQSLQDNLASGRVSRVSKLFY